MGTACRAAVAARSAGCSNARGEISRSRWSSGRMVVTGLASQTVDEAAVGTKYVYEFSEGSRDMRELLGGKGANVAEMTRVLGADRVPAGFTITTEACVAYMRAGQSEPDGMAEQVEAALQKLQEHPGKQLGDDNDPLLVSVRSGARESMPGMLDTVLNLGINDRSVEGLAKTPEKPPVAR